MKSVITPTYTFTPSAQTLDLSAISGFSIKRLYAVLNQTRGTLLYAAGTTGYGYTSNNSGLLTLAASTAGMGSNDDLMIIYDDGTTPLPAGAAQDSTLTSILTALQSQKVMTVWTDDTGAFFILQFSPGVGPVWITPTGAASSAPGTGMRPAGGESAVTTSATYQAVSAGTGFSIGDYLSHIVTSDPTTGNVIGYFWLNISTNTKLSSIPPANSFVPVTALPTNAAQENNGNLAAIKTALGSPFQAGASIGNTTFGISGLLPAFAVIPTVNIGTIPLAAGAALAANQSSINADGGALSHITNFPATQAVTLSGQSVSITGAVSTTVTNFPATQAVTISSLPSLGAGTAIVGKFGIDQTTPGVTNGVVITAMPSLPSGTAALGSIIVSNFPATQAISVASLPLPSGAATSANQASLVTTTAGTAERAVMVDPASGNAAMVTAFHNVDNQAFGGTSYGIMTGGVDQLINGSGNLDRKRAVSGDSMAITGIEATGTMLWNGTTFDRAYGDKTNGMWVNVKAGSLSASTTTTYNSTPPTITNGNTAPLQSDVNGSLKTLPTAGGNSITVKAGYTGATPSDTALVVAISPNSVNPNGQALSVASAPVVIASDQSAIPVTLSGASSVIISGTPSVAATQSGTWNIGTITTLPAITGTVAATQSGTWNIGTVASITGTVTVSGTVTANAGTNLNTSALALETGGNLAAIKTAVTGTLIATVAGDTSAGSADSGKPVKIGGIVATSQTGAAATAGNRTNATFDKASRLVVTNSIRTAKLVQITAALTTSSATVVAAGGANIFNDIYGIIITNTSATSTYVTLVDNANSYVFAAPANDTRGISFTTDSAIPQSVSNTAWTATIASGSATVSIAIMYVQNV